MKFRDVFSWSKTSRSRDPSERWGLTQILVLLTAAFLGNFFFAH